MEVVREDPVNSNLLYAGTHFGLFASFDGGGHWLRVGDLPNVRVDDLQIHPRTADLVIATHGRSIDILDDTRRLPRVDTRRSWLNRPISFRSRRRADFTFSLASPIGTGKGRLSRRKSAGGRFADLLGKGFYRR